MKVSRRKLLGFLGVTPFVGLIGFYGRQWLDRRSPQVWGLVVEDMRAFPNPGELVWMQNTVDSVEGHLWVSNVDWVTRARPEGVLETEYKVYLSPAPKRKKFIVERNDGTMLMNISYPYVRKDIFAQLKKMGFKRIS